MTRFTLTHEIGCDPEVFWRAFLDREFNEKLYLQELGFSKFTILEQHEDEGGRVRRRVWAVPRMNLPSPVAKVLGETFSYVEESEFDPASQTWRWKMIPNTLADKIQCEGTVRAEELDAGRCRRVVEVVVEAKIFGIGKLLEGAAESEQRGGWDKSAVFTDRWVRERARG